MGQYISVDHTNCTGCKTCEMVCSIYHGGESNVWKSAIRVLRKETGGTVFSLPLVCQQCLDPACLNACPTGAILRTDGFVTFIKDECIQCGACVDACPADCVPIDTDGNVVMFCDLCGGDPLCVPNCHGRCLKIQDNDIENGSPSVQQLAQVLEQEELWHHIPGRRSKK
jgi:anaerobic carbon-monoxide dehydrogenase iron sulfur subunit